MQDITHKKPQLHVFICCNDRGSSDLPSCSPTITPDQVREIKEWIRSKGWTGVIVATKTGCQGFCNPEGGVICIYPSGKYAKGITSTEEIKKFIEEEVKHL